MSRNQYSASELADYLLKKVNRPAGEAINLMKLGALLYYCEAWSLAVFDRELIDEELQAWDHGPVFQSDWDRPKHKGWNDLAADDLDCATSLDEETRGLLDDVFQAYGEFALPDLEKMIKQDAPWKEARRGLPAWDLAKKPMNKATIASFYKTAFEAEQAGQAGQAAPTNQTAARPARAEQLSQQYS